MSTQPKTLLTPEEYLAIEREAGYKRKAELEAPQEHAGWNPGGSAEAPAPREI